MIHYTGIITSHRCQNRDGGGGSPPLFLFCKVIHNHNQRSPFFINFLWTTTPIKWPKIGVLTPNFINKCTRQCGSKILRNSYALRHSVLYCIWYNIQKIVTKNVVFWVRMTHLSGDWRGPWEFSLVISAFITIEKQFNSINIYLKHKNIKCFLLFLSASISKIYFHIFIVYTEALELAKVLIDQEVFIINLKSDNIPYYNVNIINYNIYITINFVTAKILIIVCWKAVSWADRFKLIR